MLDLNNCTLGEAIEEIAQLRAKLATVPDIHNECREREIDLRNKADEKGARLAKAVNALVEAGAFSLYEESPDYGEAVRRLKARADAERQRADAAESQLRPLGDMISRANRRIAELEAALRDMIKHGDVAYHGDLCDAHDEEDCTDECPDQWTIEHGMDGCSCTFGDVLSARLLLRREITTTDDVPVFCSRCKMSHPTPKCDNLDSHSKEQK